MTDYKDTLNLPSTDFPMRANLPLKEPETLKFWEDNDLYNKMLEKNEGNPLFVIHDGPPFSNGNIHMGTALNKGIKDFINKYKTMKGFKTPYTPGWDNHGLSIESAIIKKSKLNRKEFTVSEFRQKCHEFAQEFVDLQMTSFKRLGVTGDWDNPYLTMDPKFEAAEIKVFGEMYKKGYIYKSLKPVHWCAHDETALAEAEIEYKEDNCTSLYVKFALKDDKGILNGDTAKTYFLIWTTTPWTLPGNLAIAIHPREEYALVEIESGDKYILASALVEKTMKFGGIENYKVVMTFKGAELEYMKAAHPFLDRDSIVVNAEYVTMESGTGCVHTAPGFGADDYFTSLKYKLPIIVPVDDKGFQTEEAGKFAGLRYDKSNKAIMDDLSETGALFASEELVHSYPHCWRCRNPIIFRATPQWFCSVASFKDKAVEACNEVKWLPSWGHDRMTSMIQERTDWCISRQRHWGLPIPIFYCGDCGEIICNDETIGRVSLLFKEKGSSAWYDMAAKELVPDGFKCPKCGGSHFEKETDTLDCWFDSGSSHFSVIDGNPEQKWPADLYIEGADQFRGWFQSSLLTAIGTGKEGAPYKGVLTNGWVVDGEGKAMHKSLGNSILAEDIINQYGADILRLWIASSDYRVDIRASVAIFKQLSESYRKIRNTIRILLANLGSPETDFDPGRDMVDPADMLPIDKWALSKLNDIIKSTTRAYEDYEFHIVYHDVLNFCSIELSKLYIDITKDRLYCEEKSSLSRRSAQSAMYMILSALLKIIAPLLSYTAEEAWGYMHRSDNDSQLSVFLSEFPGYKAGYEFNDIKNDYDMLFNCRDDVLKALEEARAAKIIGKSLDADIKIFFENEESSEYKLFKKFEADLSELFITSSVVLSVGNAPEDAFTDTSCGIKITVAPANGDKCVRCWISHEDCGHDSDGQALCDRCRSVIC